MCLETIKNILGFTELGKPKDTQTITANDIIQLIAQNLGYYPNMKMFDNQYRTTTFGEYNRFIKQSRVDWLTYEAEDLDCDDFAIALWGEFSRTKHWSGLAFGEISCTYKSKPGAHALNIMITNDHSVYYVEPQRDTYQLMINEKEMIPYFIMM